MGWNQNTVPKSYVALPAVGRIQAKGPEAAGLHDRILPGRITGTLTFDIVAVDPVRVGSGRPERVGGDKLVPGIVFGPGNQPVIPGSSIKGMLRSLAEALGGGCDTQDCRPPCVVCALFGQISGNRQLMGRIGFGDATPPGKKDVRLSLASTPRGFRPRRPVGRRWYRPVQAPDAKKIQQLAVTPNSRFRGRWQLVNVRPDELGLVLTAAGFDGSFLPRIGGGKYAGLGRVRFEPVEARLRGDYRTGRWTVLSGEDLQQHIDQWRKAWKPPEGANRVLAVLRGKA